MSSETIFALGCGTLSLEYFRETQMASTLRKVKYQTLDLLFEFIGIDRLVYRPLHITRSLEMLHHLENFIKVTSFR